MEALFFEDALKLMDTDGHSGWHRDIMQTFRRAFHWQGKNDCLNKLNLEEKKMTIDKALNATELTVTLVGRLDTTTAPHLEAELKTSLDNVDSLIMDFSELEYISSAGLRVLLSAQKVMNKQGKMVIRHVNEIILEVFEVTGFTDILTIE